MTDGNEDGMKKSVFICLSHLVIIYEFSSVKVFCCCI